MATKLMARLALAAVTGALLFLPTGAGAQEVLLAIRVTPAEDVPADRTGEGRDRRQHDGGAQEHGCE